MTQAPRRDRVPADLEIGCSLRAGEARWDRTARTKTIASGDLETEELKEREPDDPDRGRTYRNVWRVWRFRARLSDAVRQQRS
jgi:hypothetical protein